MPNEAGPKTSSPNSRVFRPVVAWLKQSFNRLFESPLVRRIVVNSGYLFSATGIAAGLSLLQNILTGRLLGVAGLGLLATIMMFSSVVNKFASFRMSELVIKYVGQFTEQDDPARAAAVFKAAALAELTASLFAFGLVALLSPLASRWLAKDESLTGEFILYGLIILANLIAESSTGLLQVFNHYRRIARNNVWGSTATLGIICLVYLIFYPSTPAVLQQQGLSTERMAQAADVLMQRALPAVLVAYLIGKMVNALALTLEALRQARQHWGKGWQNSSLRLLQPQARELIHFGVSTNISATLSLVNKDAELLWISLFRSPLEVGYYKTALSLINLVQMPVSPLPQATYPELAKETARGNWDTVKTILRRGSFLAGGFTLVVTLGLAFLGKPLILALYNDPGFLPAYPALLILAAGFLFANTFYWNRIALLALGKPDFPTKLNLVLAIFKLAGVFLLVPRLGYLANASLLAASYIIGVSIAALKTRSVLAQLKRQAGSPPAAAEAQG